MPSKMPHWNYSLTYCICQTWLQVTSVYFVTQGIHEKTHICRQRNVFCTGKICWKSKINNFSIVESEFWRNAESSAFKEIFDHSDSVNVLEMCACVCV